MAKKTKPPITTSAQDSRSRVSQADIPAFPLKDAMRVIQAIADNYAFKPTRPLAVADAMGMKPTTSTFRVLSGAAIAYGLTEGGYNAPLISLTPIGRRIVAPTREGDDLAAKREAALKPRLLGQFLTKYDGAKFPQDSIARNVIMEMGIGRDAADRSLVIIKDTANWVGFLRDIRGSTYVDLSGATVPAPEAGADADESDSAPNGSERQSPTLEPWSQDAVAPARDTKSNKVFITHGKNRKFIDPLKQLLAFGGFEPVVSVERETVSQAVVTKVMSDIRSCTAAIIHVDAEQHLIDDKGERHIVLNPNVLIEIGAALALFDGRFILLVKDGVTLPSNLQGLYQVRYQGDQLDGDTTIRLLKAINDIKARPLPQKV